LKHHCCESLKSHIRFHLIHKMEKFRGTAERIRNTGKFKRTVRDTVLNWEMSGHIKILLF